MNEMHPCVADVSMPYDGIVDVSIYISLLALVYRQHSALKVNDVPDIARRMTSAFT